MGRVFAIELEGPVYTCLECNTHLGVPSDIISKEVEVFTYVFSRLFNTFLVEKTSNPALQDIFCVGCFNDVGTYGVSGPNSCRVFRNLVHGPEGSDDEV
ncbi:unnamed protein product [Eruca vesicaria subsp. sativa]|uniref:Protein yippee-like n=1 Tax=Eruca vesicaria subsp. sativa TaxID=29727 RepID=A0ABC8JN55_ERUVS|nr:unnamed protein product [Eruca vesicaria subsp. sativa]